MRSRRRARCCRSGEFDFAWNMQVEDEILQRLEKGGKGRVIDHRRAATSSSSSSTPPIRGPRSTASASSLKTKHPTLSDPAVRQAMALLVDNESIEKHIYGRTGPATANFRQQPGALRLQERPSSSSTSTRPTRSWRRPAGRRAPTASAPRTARSSSSSTRPRSTSRARRPRRSSSRPAQKAGIDIELKSVTASVFFSSDVANPDTYTQASTATSQMYTTTMTQPDPAAFMAQFASVGGRHQGEQVAGPQHHALAEPRSTTTAVKAARGASSIPVKRAAMFIKAERPGCADDHRGASRSSHGRGTAAISRKLQRPRSAAGTTTPGTCSDWYQGRLIRTLVPTGAEGL